MGDGCIEFRDYDGRYYPVQETDVVLLTRGWCLRFLWRPKFMRVYGGWLRYLLSFDSWGVQGSDTTAERRITRVGPFYIDHLPNRRRLATDLLYMRRMVHHQAREAKDLDARVRKAEATLREMQRYQPSTRGGDA